MSMQVFQASCDDVLSIHELRALSDKFRFHSDIDSFDEEINNHHSVTDIVDEGNSRCYSNAFMRNMMKQVFHYFRNCLVLLQIDHHHHNNISFEEFISSNNYFILFIDDMDKVFSSLISSGDSYSNTSYGINNVFTNSKKL